MKRKVLSFVMLVAMALGLYAQAPADGTYLVYDETNDAFLVRNGSWGTMVTYDDCAGLPVTITTTSGITQLSFVDMANVAWKSEGDGAWANGDKAADITKWTLEAKGEGFAFKNNDGKYLVFDASGMCPRPTGTADNAASYKFLTAEQYKAVLDKKHVAKFNAIVAKAAGKNTLASMADLASKYDAADVTANVTFEYVTPNHGNVSEAYQPVGDDNGNTDNTKNRANFNVSVPAAGIYKISVPCMYRIGENAFSAEMGTKGFDLNNNRIYTADYAADVPGQTIGKSDTKYDGDADITVSGTTCYVPNSMASFEAHANAGLYYQDVYAYAPAAGKIAVKIDSRIGRNWNGNWLIWMAKGTKVYQLTEVVVSEPTPDPEVTTTVFDDFNAYTPVTVGICTYAKDMETNGTTYSQLVPVDTWTAVDNGDTKAGGVFAYGSGAWLGGKDYEVPATNPEGEATGNALGLVAVWSGSVQYTKDVELAPGENTITFKMRKIGATTAFASNLFGFVPETGTATYLTSNTIADDWTEYSVVVKAAAATKGKISVGYTSTNAGSGSQQKLFLDKITISNKVAANLGEFAAAVAEARAKLGFDKGEYAPYNNVEAMQALVDAANADVADYAALDAVISALKAATWTANADDVDAVYNGDFQLSTNDGELTGWRQTNNTLGGSLHSRAFVLTSGMTNYEQLAALQPDNATRSAAYLRFDNTNSDRGSQYVYGGGNNTNRYGNTAAVYEMPLKKGVNYRFSADFGGWGSNDKNLKFYIKDAADNTLGEVTEKTKSNCANVGGTANHISFDFVPTIDGNVYLWIQNPGEQTQSVVVSNVSIARVPKLEQTITWEQDFSAVEAGVEIELTATASSGLAVTYTVEGPGKVEGNKFTATGAKTITITANQAGNDEYAAAEPVSKTFNPLPGAQAIIWEAIYVDAKVGQKIMLDAEATSGLPVSYELIYGANIATLSGDILMLTGEGTVKVRATQEGNEEWKPAKPVIKEFFVGPGEIGEPVLATGDYWLMDLDYEAFVIRNGNWGTMATLDTEYGQVISAKVDEVGICIFTFMDSKGELFEDVSGKYFCDFKGGDTKENEFLAIEADYGVIFKNVGTGNYIGTATDESGVNYPFATADAEKASVFGVMDNVTAKEYVAAKRNDQLNTLIGKAGIDGYVQEESDLTTLVTLTDVTEKCALPTENTEAYQPGTNENKIDNSKVMMDVTITVPEKGLYVIEFPAMYRNANNNTMKDFIAADFDLWNTVIETPEFSAPVLGLSAGLSETNYDYAGKDEDNNAPVAFQVDGNMLWAPNGIPSFAAWVTNGNYMNTIYAYAEGDGATIPVKAIVKSGATWQGQWYINNANKTKVYKAEEIENGIAGIAADDTEATFYNIQGIRVATPKAGELYIVVKGDKVYKTIVK